MCKVASVEETALSAMTCLCRMVMSVVRTDIADGAGRVGNTGRANNTSDTNDVSYVIKHEN